MVGLSHHRDCGGDFCLARQECGNSTDCHQFLLAGCLRLDPASHAWSVLLGAMENDEILLNSRISLSRRVVQRTLASQTYFLHSASGQLSRPDTARPRCSLGPPGVAPQSPKPLFAPAHQL